MSHPFSPRRWGAALVSLLVPGLAALGGASPDFIEPDSVEPDLVEPDLVEPKPVEQAQAGARGWTPHNVVVIVADDLGVDLVGAYEPYYASLGHPNPAYPNSTPNIDRFAAEGLLFENAWVPPVCSATRAALLTGRHGHHSGVGTVIRATSGDFGLSVDVPTIPTRLAQLGLGYRSAALGKWHLAGAEHMPTPPGGQLHPLGTVETPWFETFAGGLSGGLTSYNDWTKSFSGVVQLPSACVPGATGYCSAQSDLYATVDTADDAIFMLEEFAAGPDPFFLYLAFHAPHVPLEAPLEPLPDPPAGCALTKPGYDDCIDAGEPDGPRDTRCMVRWLDYELGRVLCALDDTVSGPTTVILIGDNGTAGNQAVTGGIGPKPHSVGTVSPFNPAHAKGTLYEQGVGVPLIVRSPLIADTTPQLVESTSALVMATDLLATIEHLATGVAPAPAALEDSVSFVPVLEGISSSERTHAYAEYFEPNFVPLGGIQPPEYFPQASSRALRDAAGYKLIEEWGQLPCGSCRAERFFDLAADPFETTDLIERAHDVGDPLHPYYLDLRARLDARPSVVPPFPPTCPGVRYCVPATSASGCQPQIETSGSPSATAGEGFCVAASRLEGGKNGLMFYGVGGRQSMPWGSLASCTGSQCVTPPVTRTPLQNSAGTLTSCDGQLLEDLNQYWAANPGKNPGAGAVVQAQFWYRDALNPCPKGSSMSEAVEFSVGP